MGSQPSVLSSVGGWRGEELVKSFYLPVMKDRRRFTHTSLNVND